MNVAATVPPPKASGMSHQLYQATGGRAAGGGVASSISILRGNDRSRGVCKAIALMSTHHETTDQDRIPTESTRSAERELIGFEHQRINRTG
ncbi:hypothetical protein GCM10022233_72520 [Streptomyces shaanxiensis]|uniref:Uncharacterized protein n=1 Tax=Streptomyces shaanxiensis TaxID=653357 RepID=A0ABP7W564_9ACTN